MRTEPFFSVVVPCYNRASMIGKTIQSLQNQTYSNYEIIVVDDGSTDDTEAVINGIADPKTRYIKKQNGERAAARNFGAGLAKGDYLNFFDSDDIAYPNHLSEAAQLISEKNGPEWFHLGYKWADENGKVFKKENRFSGEFLNDAIADGNHLSVAGVFVRKDIFTRQPFNEDRALSASEDYELWLRLAARYPLHYSNVITSLYIDHKSLEDRKDHNDELIRRKKLFLHYLQSDKEVMRHYKQQFHKIRMDAHSYIALYLAEQPKYKLKSLFYIGLALGDSLNFFMKKRFYATIKKLLVQW